MCLKHLRQHDYSEAFDALQKKSKILLEDPILTQLHYELVVNLNVNSATLCCICAHRYLLAILKRQKTQCVKQLLVKILVLFYSSLTTLIATGGLFDNYISQQLVHAKWTSIPLPNECVSGQCTGQQHKLTPDMRGGHQMCIDHECGQLFLFGGWDGAKELGDLWQFTMSTQRWTCLSLDTSQEVSIIV